MTTEDIEPTMLAQILDGAERVLVQTHEQGWQLGRRSVGLYGLYSCLGRMTVTDADEVYHSMLGSVPTYNADEFATAIQQKQIEVDQMKANLLKLIPLP